MFGWFAAASAETICTSNCDFSSIAAAVASVPEQGEGTFQISAGNYIEPSTIAVAAGRTIALTAQGAVTISNSGDGPVLSVSGLGSSLSVEGVSLTAFNDRALEVSSSGVADVTDSVLYTIGLQDQGGAVLVDRGSLTAHGTLFLDNVATSGGGHILATDAVVTLEDCTFSGGFARRGGAILLIGASGPTIAYVSGGRFTDNLAAELGGAIAVNGEVELTLEAVTFEENAADSGGAIADYGTGPSFPEIRILGSLFSSNRATDKGGAIASMVSTWSIEDSTFSDNTAELGGALGIEQGSTTLDRNLLCANRATSGGAVWSRTDTPQLWRNDRMLENTAEIGGGAVDHAGASLSLRHVNLLGNRASVGGAVRSDGTLSLRNSLVGFTEGAIAVVGAVVRSDRNAYWSNVVGNLSRSPGPGEPDTGTAPELADTDVFADPRLERYQVGNGCAAIDDFYSWYGPLRDGAEELSEDPDGSRGDLGAFGGTAAPLEAWSNDIDADGFPPLYDCVEGNGTIHPDAPDPPYDGIDQNCDRSNDFDRDGDGWSVDLDCNDNDPRINPGARDQPGLDDQNCDGTVDVDGDGYSPPADCNDQNPRIHPGAVEDLDPTVDLDCVPPADVARPLEPRTCGTAPGGARIGLAWLARRRR